MWCGMLKSNIKRPSKKGDFWEGEFDDTSERMRETHFLSIYSFLYHLNFLWCLLKAIDDDGEKVG